MLDINKDLPSCRSKARRNMAAEMSEEPIQRCPACLSLLRRMPDNSKPQGCRCVSCGLIVQAPDCGSADMERVVQHYRSVDPHERVAASKSSFYYQALHYIDSKVVRHPRRLLDVGCGFGYFLEKAEAFRWETLGVEIVPEAVLSAKGRVPAAHVFRGDLKAAKLPAASLDAVTMWDVLSDVEDPAAELEECHRILAPGGIIGIRLRNVASQLWLCRCFSRLFRLWGKLGIKPLHVFHRYNFTCKAIEQILVHQGFVNILIHNSALTTGDPYQYFSVGAAVGLGKSLASALFELVYRLTHGRSVIGPSLLVWAQKPWHPSAINP
jgi:SAM-dependent methyltransferase